MLMLKNAEKMMRDPTFFPELKSDKMSTQNVENSISLFTHIFNTITRLINRARS